MERPVPDLSFGIKQSAIRQGRSLLLKTGDQRPSLQKKSTPVH